MIQKLKGFRDIFGEDIHYWHKIENILQEYFIKCGFQEFRLPILEKTAVFRHSIGENTDIVEKEMFTFMDSDESVTLRPEGTSALIRAYVENNLSNIPGIKKYYYLGNMFRRERPQKGRFRQFTQIGVEVLESDAPLLDADVISILYKIAELLGLEKYVTMEINSIGCNTCRPSYKKELVGYLSNHKEKLCDDCKRRLQTNPMRVLDCKVERCKNIVASAPYISKYLCDECNTHFNQVKKYLDILNVSYKVNERMVRGLDYYVRTAFELVTDKLGAASAVGAGGRYDGLVEKFGGKNVEGIGFAIGIDRIVDLLKEYNPIDITYTDIFVLVFEEENLLLALNFIDNFRKDGFIVEYDYHLGSMKSQMKKANKSKAKYAVILGSNEIKESRATVKDLSTGEQISVEFSKLHEYFRAKLISI